MNNLLKEHNVDYIEQNVLKVKKKTLLVKNYIIGKYIIVIIKDNTSKDKLKELNDIKSELFAENKQLIVIKQSEIDSYKKLSNMLNYLNQYNPELKL